jgi:hypothetical protein
VVKNIIDRSYNPVSRQRRSFFNGAGGDLR